MQRLAAVLAVLTLGAGVVRADFHAGQEAYDRGDYAAAILEWRPLAIDGDAETQYRLGRMYYHGQGGQSDAEAAKWYRMAAERGHALAQNNLALMYEQGRGVDQDLGAAAEWYGRAADLGLAVAQNNLARFYDEGRGVAADPARAARWYERAAGQKHAPAQYRLAQLYEEGRGVPQNAKKAAKWFRKAAANGYDGANAALDELEYRRYAEDTSEWVATTGTDAQLPAVETDIGEPEATEIPEPPAPVAVPDSLAALRARADAGDTEAQFALGKRYATGSGVKADMDEAARWYLAAAESGHAMAAYTVGFMYYRSRGFNQDLVQAYRWFAAAAALGVGDAKLWLDTVDEKMNEKEREEAQRLLAEPPDEE